MAKKSPYTVGPVAPANKTASSPLIQNASLGNEAPNMVPNVVAKTSGLPHQFPQAGNGAHGFGHYGNQRSGHTRLSGNPAAHKIGKKR